MPGNEDLRPPETAHIPRAASYTYFPQVKDLFDDSAIVELKGTISEDQLKSSIGNDGDEEYYSSSGGTSPENEAATPTELPPPQRNVSRRSSRFLLFSGQDTPAEPKAEKSGNFSRTRTENAGSKSPSRSLSKLRRKSWISSQSRSSSPTKDSRSQSPVEGSSKSTESSNAGRRKSLVAVSSPIEKTASEDIPAGSRKGAVLTKKPKRPLSALLRDTNSGEPVAALPNVPPLPLLPRSFSTDRLHVATQSPTSPNHIPPIPRNLSSEKLKGTRTEPRKKDELWSVFRTLDGDLRKFQAKSIALKANIIRTSLLPFLRTYSTHPSNNKLRPEDLDRRANILNGWWTGLLELLAGRNNQSISGTDRPAILEGIAGIMERPEWRLSPSPFCALANRMETASTATSNSTASLSSASSDFLAESVYHNVRNIFIQNLLSQMAFVVDKMSLRNAAASLVTFCGKTCAYAFFFCPGVADILVRIWDPSLDTMRRVIEESGLSRQTRLGPVSDQIVPAFPPSLHALKFISLAKTVRLLRKPATPPLGTAHLEWYGPWMKRWTGTESDLFYIFVKHYHILVADFLPPEPTYMERLCAPGLVMVYAQILINLDATINRHSTLSQQEDQTNGPAPITFDDVLGEPDASASNLSVPPINATRQMAENRLIMLIRDFLSERSSHYLTARHMFAEAFGQLLKASARRFSIYDSNACYTLCDFLEEAFVILIRYEQLTSQNSVLDWPFWLSVCRLMAASHNTTTEMKLYAFLYSIWSTVIIDDRRKTDLCLDFLLEEEFFESRFNHWCPMVRSYFMRLVCWRIARYDGEGMDCDLDILKALSARLRSIWAHYLWLRDEAELRNTVPPSTAPCNPAPGRKLLIIRNDNPIVAGGGPFLSFDGVVQSSPSRRLSSFGAISETDSRPVSAQSTDSSDFGQGEEDTGKKRWSLLRSFISAPKSRSRSRSPGPTPKDESNTSLSLQRVNSHSSTINTRKEATEERPPVPSHRSFCFRFSLEWVDKRFAHPTNMRLFPPRLPLPAQIFLQEQGIYLTLVKSSKPTGAAATSSRYAGRALAEWAMVVHECQNFFERRKNEGVPSNRLVETPTLAVEAFRRPA